MFHKPMRLPALLVAALPFLALLGALPSQAAILWAWSYSGNAISANGTFTTEDTPDGSGFYLITAITGTRNGVAITGLQPTGTPIPGNAPFDVDNLVRLAGPQLTHSGFGFALADGTYANPFFADFLPVPEYLEFFSLPPYSGTIGEDATELSITFTANPITEPTSLAVMAAGLLTLRAIRRRRTGKPPA